MRKDDHSAINVRLFIANPGGRHDPVGLPGLDMIKVSVAPLVCDFVYEKVRSHETQAYRVVSRHFDPQGARVGILLEPVEAVENSPFL